MQLLKLIGLTLAGAEFIQYRLLETITIIVDKQNQLIKGALISQ